MIPSLPLTVNALPFELKSKHMHTLRTSVVGYIPYPKESPKKLSILLDNFKNFF